MHTYTFVSGGLGPVTDGLETAREKSASVSWHYYVTACSVTSARAPTTHDWLVNDCVYDCVYADGHDERRPELPVIVTASTWLRPPTTAATLLRSLFTSLARLCMLLMTLKRPIESQPWITWVGQLRSVFASKGPACVSVSSSLVFVCVCCL